MSFFYFSGALFFSHFAYRHFKALNQQGLLADMNIVPGFNGNQGADYGRMQE